MVNPDSSKEHCPICGERAFHRDVRPMEYEYKGQFITVQQPGFWCDSCGEGIIDGKDSKATQLELQKFRSQIDGLLTPSEIREIRHKLHLKQKEAGEIFGGGPNAFSRYETGAISAPKSLSLLLQILDDKPEIFFSNILPKPSNNHFTDHAPHN